MTTISAAQMLRYQKTATRFAQKDQEQLAARYQQAQTAARQAAALLRREFAVQQIWLFGSLVHADRFHWHSDIDLAVRGLPEVNYYRAVGRLQGIDAGFSIDLIRDEDAPPALLDLIEQEGVLL
jgi:uncharacterized protein